MTNICDADTLLSAAEVQGDEAETQEDAPKGANLADEQPGSTLDDIDFDDGW